MALPGPEPFFEITPSGGERVLHQFGLKAADGAGPEGSLVVMNGKLYGTTSSAGTKQAGTVFEITSSGGNA